MLCLSCRTQPHTVEDCDYANSCTCLHRMKPEKVTSDELAKMSVEAHVRDVSQLPAE